MTELEEMSIENQQMKIIISLILSNKNLFNRVRNFFKEYEASQ